ncbi:MAG: hypothetical protein HYU38_06115, partial [Candidatus Tectomicrobia bacterium]|nr:hypothetical protein [Candidatus Tectomicrobia bacterium]
MARFTDPIEVRGLRLKHRVLMSAMTTSRAGEDGSPSPWTRAHYTERARGGAAVCFSEASFVSPEGKGFPSQLGVHEDSLVPGLRYTHAFTVGEAQTVPALYPESLDFTSMPKVLATGFMVGLIEWACL